MGKFTEEELDMLSPEEREAIADDVDAKSVEEIRAEEEAEAAAKAKEEGAGAAQRVIDKKSEEPEPETVIKAEEEKAKVDEAVKVAEEAKAIEKDAGPVDDVVAERAKVEKEVVPQSPAEPAFVLEAEKKFGTKEEIEAKITALDTKFEDGDITLAAYNKERADYVSAITEMGMFEKINMQVMKAAAEKNWKDARSGFFKNNPEYLSNRIKNVAYVDAVNRLLATEESKNMTDNDVLEAAKKECDAVFHPNSQDNKSKEKDDKKVVELDKKRAEDNAEKAKALEAAKKTESEKAATVKTLANVPVSESNQGEDKYDLLDKLSGMAYEEAVAKLSDAERKIYAARA